MHQNLLSACLLGLVVSAAFGQELAPQTSDEGIWFGWSPPRSKLPEAYQREAIRLILREANQIAAALHLPEPSPITESHLAEYYLSPLRYAQENGALGNITTSNYTYCISHANKLCYVMGRRQEENILEWKKNYSWPLSRIDTNAAYQLATQWLAAASMDVAGLNRDYHVFVRAEESDRKPDHFIPVYWVAWAPRKGSFSVASVRLFAPAKTLMQLRVENTNYILRPAITFTNVDALLPEPKRE